MTTQEILADYHRTESMNETARNLKISEKTVKKHLITAGAYATPRSRRIMGLYSTGMPVKDIAVLLKISEGTVLGDMPYTKGTYLTPDAAKSQNAMRIKKCRAKKK